MVCLLHSSPDKWVGRGFLVFFAVYFPYDTTREVLMSAIKITDNSTDISEADYLAGEQRANIRHEYVDGKVYAMAGTSLRHNDIAMNIAFALRLAARGTPCRVNVSDVKVCAEKPKAYYYPDVMLGCDRDESSKHYLEKPCVIVEITSPSTEWKDRHQKTVAYQKSTPCKRI